MLNKDEADILSDLIKIGIPSLVAVLAAYIAYKKELVIERLKAEVYTHNEINSRKAELIQNISSALTKLHTAFFKFAQSVNYRKKQNDPDLEKLLTELESRERSDRYTELASTIQDCYHIKSLIFLLGDQIIISEFESYWLYLMQFMNKNDNGNIDKMDFPNDCEIIRQKQERIFMSLSKIFLLANKPE